MTTVEEKVVSDSESRQKIIATLRELIREIPVGMLSTVNANGRVSSRPMVNINSQFEGELWFFSHADNQDALDIASNNSVNVTFACPEDRRYVSASGVAEIIDDSKRAELLWTDECQPWFPKGINDPGLRLIRIEVKHAEYWNDETSVVTNLVDFFKNITPGMSAQERAVHKGIDW